MPIPCSALTAATLLTLSVSTQMPTKEDLSSTPWCYATKGGQAVESWILKPDGKAVVTEHVRDGERVTITHKGSTWALRRNHVIVRSPKFHRRVLKIESMKGQRIYFTDETQMQPCRTGP